MELLYKYIDASKKYIIKQASKLIQIPSILSESTDKSKPFGEEINNALEYTLNLAKQLGFKTKNIDGYCGYIEFGEGDELVGIIGHLDVVPVSDGWTYPPFSGTITSDKLYGRGAVDDKGPVIASIFAMKAVMENCVINKRVRLILGLSEETSWDCMKYYKAHEELPTVSFSPDGDFPCIYAEKGFYSLFLKEDYSANSDITISNIICDNVLITVPDKCTIELKIKNIDIDKLISELNNSIKKNNYNINVEKTDNSTIKLISSGISSHGAHPEKGKNAIAYVLLLLKEVFDIYNIALPILDFYSKYIGTDYTGKNLDICFEDESGILTLNVGKLDLIDNKISIGINIRFPINTSTQDISYKINNILNTEFNSISLEDFDKKNSLYVPKDNFLVNTLTNIYNEISGSKDTPIAIGGTTFAKAFDNCVAFGPTLPTEEFAGHKIDEFISLDNLIMSSKIYAKAIYELAK